MIYVRENGSGDINTYYSHAIDTWGRLVDPRGSASTVCSNYFGDLCSLCLSKGLSV